MATEGTAAPRWRRSRFCSDINCLEILAEGEDIAIRDSHDPDGPVLVVSADSWRHLLASIKDGSQG
jgi:hypothetical protein